MRLRKVISGGQTGADYAGLVEAAAHGFQTGGHAPAGYRTEDGPNRTLKLFGLQEHPSSAYPPRTKWNVRNADATVWFGNTSSPGGKLTRRYCQELDKPFIANPTIERFRTIANTYEIINIAGNRQSTNPAAAAAVRICFAALQEN